MRIQIGNFEFRPGPWPSIAAMLLIAIFIALGFWQIRRGDEKSQIIASAAQRQMLPVLSISGAVLDLHSMQYRRVSVSGIFDTGHTMYLDNKIERGQPGFQVLIPLRISDSNSYVLVNRGWVAMRGSRNDLPPVPTPQGTTTIESILHLPGKGVGVFGGGNRSNSGWPALYRWVDVLSIAAETGLPLKPYVILQQAPVEKPLVRNWQLISGTPDKNYAYAMQWFTFAGIVLLLWVKLNLHRRKESVTP